MRRAPDFCTFYRVHPFHQIQGEFVIMTCKTTDLAKARRRVAEKKKRAKAALQKFRENCAARGVPVFASVRRAA